MVEIEPGIQKERTASSSPGGGDRPYSGTETSPNIEGQLFGRAKRSGSRMFNIIRETKTFDNLTSVEVNV